MKRDRIEINADPDAKPIQLKPREIDNWFATAPIRAPRGGEIVGESVETFDYPVEPASDEELNELHIAMIGVIERYTHMTKKEEQDEFERMATLDAAILRRPDNILEELRSFIETGSITKEAE